MNPTITLKPLTSQIEEITQLLNLGGTWADTYAQALPTLPDGAEGWFAFPRWQKIASTYEQAIQQVLSMISQNREHEIHNYVVDRLGPEYIREHEHTTNMFRNLNDQQKGSDILVVPAQFGARHYEISPSDARKALSSSEFGLSAFAVGWMLLMHPERLSSSSDSWIFCLGDEYSWSGDGNFRRVPTFRFHGNRIEFGTDPIDVMRKQNGAASAILPQR